MPQHADAVLIKILLVAVLYGQDAVDDVDVIAQIEAGVLLGVLAREPVVPVIGMHNDVAVLRQVVLFPFQAAAHGIDAGRDIAMVGDDHGKRPLAPGQVHDAGDGQVIALIEDQVAGRWEYGGILHQMHLTAMRDGALIPVFIEEEPGSGGKNQVAAIQKFFREGDDQHNALLYHKLEGKRPEGDKVIRADIWFKDAANGKVFMVEGHWNEEFLNQLDNFPEAPYDDRIDSASGARLEVAPIISWSEVKFLSLGMDIIDDKEEEIDEESDGIISL